MSDLSRVIRLSTAGPNTPTSQAIQEHSVLGAGGRHAEPILYPGNLATVQVTEAKRIRHWVESDAQSSRLSTGRTSCARGPSVCPPAEGQSERDVVLICRHPRLPLQQIGRHGEVAAR